VLVHVPLYVIHATNRHQLPLRLLLLLLRHLHQLLLYHQVVHQRQDLDKVVDLALLVHKDLEARQVVDLGLVLVLVPQQLVVNLLPQRLLRLQLRLQLRHQPRHQLLFQRQLLRQPQLQPQPRHQLHLQRLLQVGPLFHRFASLEDAGCQLLCRQGALL